MFGSAGPRDVVDPYHGDDGVRPVLLEHRRQACEDLGRVGGRDAPVDDAHQRACGLLVEHALELLRVGVLPAERGRRLADAQDAERAPLPERGPVPPLLHPEEGPAAGAQPDLEEGEGDEEPAEEEHDLLRGRGVRLHRTYPSARRARTRSGSSGVGVGPFERKASWRR